ncbi:MAG: hypothetical protein Q7T56_07380 [Nocardioidaceae bacterium]|nr:hypothetical protein [Nocardioidaceae bacterium]
MSAEILQMGAYDPDICDRRVDYSYNGDLLLARKRLGIHFDEGAEDGMVLVSHGVAGDGCIEVLLDPPVGKGLPDVELLDQTIAALTVARNELAARR